jgi:hypothetical protein
MGTGHGQPMGNPWATAIPSFPPFPYPLKTPGSNRDSSLFQSTPKQWAASRANAQKSTGPRAAAGKATSRFNALKHGIYEYHELYTPADSHERFLVDAMVHNEWRLRRIRRAKPSSGKAPTTFS